jgi:hypothetical protein
MVERAAPHDATPDNEGVEVRTDQWGSSCIWRIFPACRMARVAIPVNKD